MAKRNNNHNLRAGERELNTGRSEQRSASGDLPDNEHDSERLQGEETTINLPDVSDIPGQQNISAPPLGELADTTASSDDEEGRGIFDDEEDTDVNFVMGTEGDVRKDERKALDDDEYMPTRDENNLRNARMDDVDFEGEPLNEGSFGEQRSGGDLDVPGTRADNRNENIGEEDEENNEYSLGGDDNNRT